MFLNMKGVHLRTPYWETSLMGALLLFLLLTLLLFGAGVALHLLWWIAVIFLVIWLVGFMMRPSGGRWYRW